MKPQKRLAIIATVAWIILPGEKLIDQIQSHNLHFIWEYAVAPLVILWVWMPTKKTSN